MPSLNGSSLGHQKESAGAPLSQTHRYSSSLDPALSRDENRDHCLAEWLLGLVPDCATEGEQLAEATSLPGAMPGSSSSLRSSKCVRTRACLA